MVLTVATFSVCNAADNNNANNANNANSATNNNNANSAAAHPAAVNGKPVGRPFSNDTFPNGKPAYVQIIVKACHPAETSLKPINQGKSYDHAKSMSDAKRNAMFKKLGCVDIPIPMQWVTGTMTPYGCQNHAGYLASMQFLEQRNESTHDGLTAVGGWRCIISNKPFVNTVGQ
jgi:hypothetical protein